MIKILIVCQNIITIFSLIKVPSIKMWLLKFQLNKFPINLFKILANYNKLYQIMML